MKSLIAISLTLITLASCAGPSIQTREFTVEKAANLKVAFFKVKSKKGFDVGFDAQSLTGKVLVARKSDFTCGKGTTDGVIRSVSRTGSESFVMFYADAAKEFHVYCGNAEINKAEGDYYVKIKNLYTADNAGQPEKVIATDIKLELK